MCLTILGRYALKGEGDISHKLFLPNSWQVFIKTKFMVRLRLWYFPAGNYMFKVNNRNTRKRCEICSKLTIKTPERRHHWHRSGVFIVNFEHISHCSSVSIVNFEQANADWV